MLSKKLFWFLNDLIYICLLPELFKVLLTIKMYSFYIPFRIVKRSSVKYSY